MVESVFVTTGSLRIHAFPACSLPPFLSGRPGAGSPTPPFPGFLSATPHPGSRDADRTMPGLPLVHKQEKDVQGRYQGKGRNGILITQGQETPSHAALGQPEANS